LGYLDELSFFAVGSALQVHHQTVQRCVERALLHGALSAPDDLPRPGKEPTITGEAKGLADVTGLPQSEGFGLSGRIVDDAAVGATRAHGPAAGHSCLGPLAQGWSARFSITMR
jgi:hypothetical protein